MVGRSLQRVQWGRGCCSPSARGEPGGDTALASAEAALDQSVAFGSFPPRSASAPLAKAVSPPVSRGRTQLLAVSSPCYAKPRHAGGAELRRGSAARCSLANDEGLRPSSLTFSPSARAARVPPPPCAARRVPRLLERGEPPPSSPSPLERRVAETRRASSARKLALVIVRGHRLSRLSRGSDPTSRSLFCKYSPGSGGGAPRPA